MIIVDVREPDEYARGHVSNAHNIPLSQLLSSKMIHQLPKNEQIIVYCNSGNRSAAAQHFLQKSGYTDVLNGINRQKVEEITDF